MLDYTALSRISAFVLPLERFPVKYFEAIAVDLWGLWPFALIVTVIIIALLLLTLAPCGQKKLGRPVSSKAQICGALCRSRDLIPVLVPKETPSVDADIGRAICIIFFSCNRSRNTADIKQQMETQARGYIEEDMTDSSKHDQFNDKVAE